MPWKPPQLDDNGNLIKEEDRPTVQEKPASPYVPPQLSDVPDPSTEEQASMAGDLWQNVKNATDAVLQQLNPKTQWDNARSVLNRVTRAGRGGLYGLTHTDTTDILPEIAKGFKKETNRTGSDVLDTIPDVASGDVPTAMGRVRDKVAAKAAQFFFPTKTTDPNGEDATRYMPLPAADEKPLEGFAKSLDRLTTYMPGLMGKGLLNAASKVVRNPGKVDKTAEFAMGSPSSVNTDVANVPKKAAEFSIDALSDAEGWALQLGLPIAGKAAKTLLKVPAVASAYSKIASTVMDSPLLQYFRRAWGASEDYVKLKDDLTLQAARVEKNAVDWGEKVAALPEAEQKRVAQLIASSSEQKIQTVKVKDPDTGDMVEKRVKLFAPSDQIKSLTSRPDLAEHAIAAQEIMADLHNEMVRVGKFADTYNTKLTRSELTALRAKQTDLMAKIEKVKSKGAFPMKERLLQMANDVTIRGDKQLGGELTQLADRMTANIGESLQRGMMKVEDQVDEFAGRVNQGVDKIRTRAENVTGRRRDITQLFSAIEGADKIPDKQKAKLLVLMNRVQNNVEGARDKHVKELVSLADDLTDGLGLKGLKPLVRAITNVSGFFPGQKKIIRQLGQQADAVATRIHMNYVKGGAGYFPRMYEFFENGYANKLMEKGLNLQDIMNIHGDQLSSLTALNKGDYDNLIEALMKRGHAGATKRTMAIDRSIFARRKDVPDELRKALGEIHTAAYPIVAKATAEAKGIALTKLFEQVSKNDSWALSPEDYKAAAHKGWTLLKGPAYGKLDGMYVEGRIAKDLLDTTRISGVYMKHWLNFLSAWKTGKVLYNPATQFRNFFSNAVLLDMSGVDLLEQPRLLNKAIGELSSKGKYFDEIKDTSLYLNSGFADAELRTFKKGFESIPQNDMIGKLMNASKEVTDKLGQLYSSNEIKFKMAKYIHMREGGATKEAALAEAEKWLFNYNKISPFVRDMKTMPLGEPFFTFTAKAIPRFVEAIATNPIRAMKYHMMAHALELQAQKKFNLTDEEMKYLKKSYPGFSVVLPAANAEGNPYVMDLSYLLPWGNVADTDKAGLLPNALPPGGPLWSLAEINNNRSSFTGNPIYNPTEGAWKNTADIADYLYKTAMPSLAPGVDRPESPIRGGYSFNKIVSALTKRPDYRGRMRSLPIVLSDTVLGLKAYPQDPAFLKLMDTISRQKDIKERVAIHRRFMMNQSMSLDAKMRERQRFVADVNRILTKGK
jgi:hypothetical protein